MTKNIVTHSGSCHCKQIQFVKKNTFFKKKAAMKVLSFYYAASIR